MKILKLLLLMLIFSIPVIAQQQPNPFIPQLSDENKRVRMTALNRICLFNMAYLGDELKELMQYENEGDVLIAYLETLYCLDYPDIKPLAENVQQRIDELFPQPDKNYLARLDVSFILLSCGDLSGEDIILDYIENSSTTWVNATNSLHYLLKGNSMRREEIKQHLKRIIMEHRPSGYHNYSALVIFSTEFSDPDVIPFLISVLEEPEIESIVRVVAAEFLLKKNCYCNPVFRDRIVNDPDKYLRQNIAGLLIDKYGSPSDLKYLIDYIPNEPDPLIAEVMSIYVKNFIPPHPDDLSTVEKIERLKPYVEELYQYEWISDHETYAALSGEAVMISELYNQQDIMELCTALNKFLSNVEDSYREYLTNEGYKFLHYTAVYIKEAVEEEFNTCPE
jgi:hypothetical protein